MPPKASTSAPAKRLSNQEVPVVYQRYRQELQGLVQKIGELEGELDEHALVMDTLQPLLTSEPDRVCYRLIGGVLVERTVKDVYPALETNHSGIKEVLQGLRRSAQSKEKEFDEFRKEYRIQVTQ